MTEAAEVLDPQMPPEQPDPRDLARAVAMSVADEPEQVGEVVNTIELDDNVTDFRLAASVRGYEGWQWSVTLYHDVEVGTWTVNESSLVPTDDALMPPAWVPWKDRLEPTDLAPTDSIGTDPDDPRLEGGFRKTEPVAGASAGETEQSGDKTEQSESVESTDEQTQDATESEEAAKSEESAEAQGTGSTPESAGSVETAGSTETAESAGTAESAESTEAQESAESQAPQESPESEEAAKAAAQAEETEEIVEEFQLSRRHVLSPKGRAQVAKRWYEGPRGPKAMSTKTADGNLCSTCGFFVPLQGDLNRMFGVCANKWSPDDGRVVSIDHGCGEHSEIEPPEPTHLWVQSKPAYDDFHIDVIAQKPRDERGAVEAIEQLDDDAQDSDEATEEDILANTEPDTGDDEPENAQPSGVEASAELEAVVSVAADGDEAEASESEADEADEAEAAEDAEAEEAESDESKSDESEKTEKSAEPAEPETTESETAESETAESDASEPAEPADANDSAEASEETKAAETVALTDLDKQVEAVDAAIEDAAASLAAEIDDEVKDALAEAESAETEDAAETVETVEIEETTETVEVEPAEAAETEKAEESTESEESEQPESAGAEEPAESSESADPEEPSDSAEAEESKDPETAEKPEEPADSAE